jgi:hypothetical protein
MLHFIHTETIIYSISKQTLHAKKHYLLQHSKSVIFLEFATILFIQVQPNTSKSVVKANASYWPIDTFWSTDWGFYRKWRGKTLWDTLCSMSTLILRLAHIIHKGYFALM